MSSDIESVKLTAEPTTVKVGQTITASAEVSPEDADYTAVWNSEDENVVKALKEDGKFIATGSGKTDIKVTVSNDGSSASDQLEITVEPTYIKGAPFTIEAGGEATVTLNIDQIPDFEYEAFQFDITCPEGISVKEVKGGTGISHFTNLSAPGQDGKYGVSFIDMSTTASNPGNILEGFVTLTLVADKTAKANESAKLSFEKIIFSSVSGTQLDFDDSTVTFTIENVPVTGVEVNPGNGFGDDRKDKEGYYQIYVDEAVSFTASTEPADATITDLEYTAKENSGAVEVEYVEATKTFTITGKQFGEEVITVTAPTYGVSNELKIKVIPMPLTISVTADNSKIKIGEESHLSYSVTPDDPKKTGAVSVKWSSDSEFVEVNETSGKVTGVGAGTATVKATAYYGVSGELTATAETEIEVQPIMPETLEISTLSLEENDSKTAFKNTEWFYITTKVSPDNATYKEIEWTVTHPDHVGINDHPDYNDGTNFVAKIKDVTQETVTLTATVKGTDVSNSIDISLSDLLPGDANDNGVVNVSDPIVILNEIRRQNDPENPLNEVFCFINSDIDTNAKIEMVDVNATIRIAQGLEPFETTEAMMLSPYLTEDILRAESFNSLTGEARIGVSLTNASRHTALQADVILPEGMTVTNVVGGPQASRHTLVYDINRDNVMRVLIYALDITAFTETDASLFTIEAQTAAVCGDLDIRNIITADTRVRRHELGFEGGSNIAESGVEAMRDADTTVTGTVGAIEILDGEGIMFTVHDTAGRELRRVTPSERVETVGMAPGIYLVSGSGRTFKVAVR